MEDAFMNVLVAMQYLGDTLIFRECTYYGIRKVV
jgi:hypothetical protein